MDIIKQLLSNVLPYYAFIILGFVAANYFKLPSKWISKALLFVFIPILIIENLMKADMKETLIAGTIVFALAVLMNIPAFLVQGNLAKKAEPNMLKIGFSYYNIGWFGIPVVTAIFGKEQLPLIVSAYVGNALYGDTIGYYLVSRAANHPVKKAATNIFKIPAIYAAILAIALNLWGVDVPDVLEKGGKIVSWVVSASGMTLIGITLSKVDFKRLSYGFYGKLMGIRYLAGGIILVGLVYLEKALVGQLDADQSNILLLIASFPVAANLLVFATNLDADEEFPAVTVGISAIISLFLVPLICLLLF